MYTVGLLWARVTDSHADYEVYQKESSGYHSWPTSNLCARVLIIICKLLLKITYRFKSRLISPVQESSSIGYKV